MSPTTKLVLTNRELYVQLRNASLSLTNPSTLSSDCLLRYVKEKILSLNLQMFDGSFEEKLRIKIRSFCNNLASRWNSKGIHRTESKFLLKQASWLDMIFDLSSLSGKSAVKNSDYDPTLSGASSSNLQQNAQNINGRPQKDFSESSLKTKKRKTEVLRACVSTEELVFAAKTSLYKEGKRSAADLLGRCSEGSPSEAVKMRHIIKEVESQKVIVAYTPEEALAFILNTGMSKEAYVQTRLGAKQRNADIYPSYEKVLTAKKLCYPEGIRVTDSGSEVPLQELLDHTIRRLVSTIEIAPTVTAITLISKWGADGNSGHPEFMQKPQSETDEQLQDSNLFLITFVPLRIIGLRNDGEEVILWQNPRPSLTRLCRPKKFIYAKESTELIRTEIQSMKNEISNLQDIIVTINDEQTVNCKFDMHLTMLDVKVINAITNNNSTQTCYLCKSKPTEMNNLNSHKHANVNPDYLEYGLTTMHAWMKFLECVLHIAYKLKLKKPTIRGISSEDLKILEDRKNTIHRELYKSMGIRVDKVVQGKGTSNTGNVARTFFANYKEASRITGVDEELIRRFWITMVALSSGHNIDTVKYDEFAKETAVLYMEKYSWYRMPVSVHKIIMHGAEVIQTIMLPIGMMSEEAQEASNKVYKQVRDKHTRKMDRIKTTTDLMNMMLAMSDPVIAKARGLPRQKKHELPQEVLPLLLFEPTLDADDEID